MAQVTDSGKNTLGFVAMDISTEKLNTMMESYQLGDTGFFMLVSQNGMLMYYPDEDREGIIRPLKKLSTASNQMAAGELNIEIHVKSKDEIGQVADSLQATVRRLKDYIRYIDEISAVLNRMASGNLNCQLELDYVGEFAKLDSTANAMHNVIDSTRVINSLIDQISNAATGQSKAIWQVASGIEQISWVVQANSATAEESAAASEELSGQASIMRDLIGQFQLNGRNSKFKKLARQKRWLVINESKKQDFHGSCFFDSLF